MVQHDGVQHFAPGLGQSERNIRDPEDCFAARQRGLDHPDSLDRLDRGADIVPVSGADREHQQVKDYVLGLHPVFLDQQLVGALGDLELAFAGDRLRLLLILVDTADHQRRAVAARERDHALEAFFAVLEVDRVDDRRARRALKRLFERDRVGRIDHQWNLDLLDEGF